MRKRVVGITSNTVPWEILRAAGFSPILLEEDPGPTPLADRWMEDVFDRRMRVIFDRLCAGAGNHLEKVVIPRTSEQEHKLYLYLREMGRTHAAPMPEIYLYNLLHTRTQESYDYGLERTRAMILEFGATEDALRAAIEESNRARGGVRRVLELRRRGMPQGSTALEWIRGFYSEDRGAYANRIARMLDETDGGQPEARPHILIKGAPLNDASLHRSVEAAGGYVVGEDDWRGSRAAGDRDVCMSKDPATAIFEKYFYDEVSPRVHPVQERDAWFQRQIESGLVDGVLFYLPLEDDVHGWNYPTQRAYLESRSIPSVVLREIDAPLREFVGGLHHR